MLNGSRHNGPLEYNRFSGAGIELRCGVGAVHSCCTVVPEQAVSARKWPSHSDVNC